MLHLLTKNLQNKILKFCLDARLSRYCVIIMSLEVNKKGVKMAIKKVLRYGEKSLREPSKEVHKVSKKIQELIRDLLDTLYTQNGVGLAAPQIGVNERVLLIREL